MTELELKRKIEDALNAIEQYNRENPNAYDSLRRVGYDQKINESVRNLIQRSHVLGAAGQKCTKCNGTGRI